MTGSVLFFYFLTDILFQLDTTNVYKGMCMCHLTFTIWFVWQDKMLNLINNLPFFYHVVKTNFTSIKIRSVFKIQSIKCFVDFYNNFTIRLAQSSARVYRNTHHYHHPFLGPSKIFDMDSFINYTKNKICLIFLIDAFLLHLLQGYWILFVNLAIHRHLKLKLYF